MSKQHEIVAVRIANYYQEDIYLSNTSKPHPRVDELKRYIERRYKENELEEFYNTVISNFKEFPLIGDLNKIPAKEKEVVDADFSRGQIEFAKFQNIRLKPLPEHLNLKSYDLIDDRYELSTNEFLKKYGLEICGKYWHLEGKIAGVLDQWKGISQSGAPTVSRKFRLTKQMVIDYYKIDTESFKSRYNMGVKNPEYFQD